MIIDSECKDYGKRVKHVRERSKLMQKEFAIKLGYAPSALSNIESGKTDPGYDFLLKLADTFNISPNYILLGEGDMFLNKKGAVHDEPNFGEQSGDVKKLLDYFSKSSLVRMAVLAYATKFILSNESLINIEIERNPKK